MDALFGHSCKSVQQLPELVCDIDKRTFTITGGGKTRVCDFSIGDFDLALVKAGGWVGYADSKY